MELKGSKTEQNLMTAFAGESQARNKYTYFASQAKKDGFEQIAAIFEETAANEKEHAKLWFKALHGGKIPTTAENLLAAAEGENYEWTDMYAQFAKEAEKGHELRYRTLLKNVEEYRVFERDGKTYWQCRNCGYIFEGPKAPEVCPVCAHPKAFFEIHKANY